MRAFSDQNFFHKMNETRSEEKDEVRQGQKRETRSEEKNEVRGWEGTSNDQNMGPVKSKYLWFRNVKAYDLVG